MIKNVVFYFPCLVTGGGQYLFIRYADAMSKYYPDYNIYYIDYKDGFARKQIGDNNLINFLDFDDSEIVQIPDYSVVIDPLNHLRHFNKYIRYNPQNTTFLFWCIAFTDLKIDERIVFNNEMKKLGQYYSYLVNQNNIAFLGHLINFQYSKQFHIPFLQKAPIPLVVPTDKYSLEPPSLCSIGAEVRFCWLGRLDNDKYLDIINYMKELGDLSKTTNISLSLIGLGSCEEKLKNDALGFPFKIDFVGEKRDLELDSFIRNRVDIGLASGTSSLEFMLRAKPVIQSWKLDKIYTPNEYKFYHFPYEPFDPENSTESRIAYVGQSTFIEKYKQIMDDHASVCKSAYTYALNKSPQEGVKNLASVIRTLDIIDCKETNNNIETMAKILTRINRRVMFIKRIKKNALFRKWLKMFELFLSGNRRISIL